MSIDSAAGDTTGLSVRALEGPGDLDAVLVLLRTALGDWPVVEGVDTEFDAAAFFRWKHEQSPFGASHVIVAERAGEIVGVRAFMPWKLATGPEEVDALRSADAATRPELERSGVFGRIRTVADDLLPPGAQIGFGTPNRKSYGATMKLGGREVVEVIRPWVRVVATRAVPAFVRRRPGVSAVDAPRAVEALGGDGVLSGLLEEARSGEQRLTTARSPAYLRWRYGDAPLSYHGVRDESGGDLRGVALFRLRSARGMPQAVIEELIVRLGDQGAARRLLRAVAATTRAPLLCGRFPCASPSRAAATTLGFLPRRDGLPLVAKRLTGDAPPIDGPQRWALSLGDIEIF